MKLQELAAPGHAKQIAKVFESYFGSSIRFDQITHRQARVLLSKVNGILREHRQTSARHTSEQDPGYLKLVILEQALSSRIKEEIAPAAPADPAAAQKALSAIKDPKLAAAIKKTQAGQSLTPDEQKLVAGNALMTAAESRKRTRANMLRESEVQQAQVVLAAQDLVDTVQKMLEDTSSLQFKELPALVDSIKNQVGSDQSAQFNTDASAALTGLVQNLQTAKQQLETALGVVTGQAPAAMPDMTQPGADMNADLDAEPDLGAAPDLGDTAVSGPRLGRARR